MVRSLAASLTALAVLVACGGNEDGNEDAEGALDLLSRVEAEQYQEWARAPGWESRRPSAAPHGAAVDIYINERVALAIANGESLGVWPEGSTIVKDGWNGTDLVLVAIMDKRSDGWYWAEFDANDTPKYSGRPSVCTGCHSIGADFVRAFGLP